MKAVPVLKRNVRRHVVRLLLAGGMVLGLSAAEYQSSVQSGGQPVPGASVTATQGDRKISTSTDERGQFTFADLDSGDWVISVDMLGFSKANRTITSSAAAAAPMELKILSQQELISSLAQRTAEIAATRPAPVTPVAPSAASTPATATPAASANGAAPATTPATGATPGTTGTAPTTTASTATPANGRGQRGNGAPGANNPGRGGNAARAANGRGGAAAATATPARDAFQQVDVNQLVGAIDLANDGSINAGDLSALNQSASDSFSVQGSVSSALGLAANGDFGGPGRGGPGGPGGFGGGVNALSADGSNVPGIANGDGAAPQQGGRGGPGSGGPGGRGGPGGGGFAGGGRGPGGGGPGGGRGGRGGGRGPANPNAFGNRRPAGQRNLYNGNAFFSLSNSALDARSYSVTGADLAKPSYGQGRGGFTFGGPIQIPKLISADKRIAFTVDYQTTRNHTGQISQAVNMPTALERQGNFSQTQIAGVPVNIFDPTTGLQFAGNQIPLARLNATSLALLNYFPNPNLPFAARNYQTTTNGVNDTNNFTSRISNIGLTSKDRVNFGIGYQSGNTITPNLFQFIDTGANRSSNSNLAWSHRFNRQMNNNLTLTFSRTRQNATPFFANLTNVAADLGIQGTSQNPVNWGPPTLNFTNYGGLTDGTYSLTRNQTIDLTDTFTWTRGKHNFSIGADDRRLQQNQQSDSNGRGTYTFTGSATSQMIDGKAQTGTGYDLADFLLSQPAAASVRFGNPDKYFRGKAYALFFNDDFRMNTKLSITMGLRWDYMTPYTEIYNRIANLDIAPGYTAVVAVQPNQVAPYSQSLPTSLIRPDKNNFSPRLGIAWKPMTKHSLVVRSGYGVYYNSAAYAAIASNMAQQPPFAQTLSVAASPSNPLNIQTGFLGASSTTLNNTFAIDPNYHVGYAQTWNLTLQNNLPFGMFFTAGYQGTKGTRLDQRFIPNSVAPGAPVSPYPNFYTYETSNGNSIYHAAQFQLNRRFSRGIMANASYQFSKSIDNAGTGGQSPIAQNWQNLSLERALSTFNVPHNLAIQFQYSSGAGRGGGALANGWRAKALKDWTVTGTYNIQSGRPLTATVGGANSQIAGSAVTGTLRANATGLPIQAAGMNFNTAAFSAPLSGQYGNAGRDTIPGPTGFTLNGQIGRIFRLGERRTADLQFSAQNILNRVTVTGWGTVVGSNNFGLISAAGNMRKVTTTLRFRF